LNDATLDDDLKQSAGWVERTRARRRAQLRSRGDNERSCARAVMTGSAIPIIFDVMGFAFALTILRGRWRHSLNKQDDQSAAECDQPD
jgi:hypothetical protein